MAAPPMGPINSADDSARGPAGFKPLNDEDIENTVSNEMQNAIGGNYLNTISEERRRALKYMYGRSFGNEVEGRSKVVMTDVLDTVNAILPALMRIFMGSKETVRYEPLHPEQEQDADNATAFVNQKFRNDRNSKGFQFLYEAFFDALVEKTGTMKVWAEEQTIPKLDTYKGLTAEQVQMLQIDIPGLEIVASEEAGSAPVMSPQGPVQVPLFNIQTRETRTKTVIMQKVIPPEEFLMGGRDYDLDDDTTFCGHRQRMIKSDLIAMGIPRELVQDLPNAASGYDTWNSERTERYSSDELEAQVTSGRNDEATAYTWVLDCYVRIDADGDGYSEAYCGLFATDGSGSSVRLLRLTPTNYNPYSSICPIPVPHKHFGISIADVVMDIQEIRSTLVRQILDNTYLTNDQRYGVLERQVNLDDFLNRKPGGYVRMKRPDAVTPMPTPQLSPQVYNLLEHMEGVKEQRTGVTRYNQGLDADSLNHTATGISSLINMANARIELIAQIFAQGGLQRHFQNWLLLLTQTNTKHEQVRVNGQWIGMSPASWSSEMRATVNVGISPSAEVQRVANSRMLLEMLGMVQQADNPEVARMVGPENIHRGVSTMIEAMGFSNPDMYMRDPRTLPPMPPPEPSIEEKELALEAQVEQTKAELELIKIQMESMQHSQRLMQAKYETDVDAAVELERIESQEQIAETQARARTNGSGGSD